MKRIGAILMIAVLCLLAACALAEQPPVQRSGALAAYVDGQGRLYLPGNPEAINTATADQLVSIDAYRVLFTSERMDGASDLYMIDLGSFAERKLAEGVYAACMADETTLYYVPAADRTQLMRMDLGSFAPATLAYTAAEPIDRLYDSAEGLVFELVDQAGTMVYVSQTDTFESYIGALPQSGVKDEVRELYLTREGELYLRSLQSYTAEHIDSNVLAYATLGDTVYYLAHTGSAVRLKGYDPEAMTWQVVLTPEPGMENQLTATAESLFMLDSRGQVYTVDLKGGRLIPFQSFADLSKYNLPADFTVTGLRIEGMSGQLNVYAQLEETYAQPDFSFIEFTSTSDAAQPVLRLLEGIAIADEESAWTWLKPAAQYDPLARGSRGDAVRAIQQPLFDLGYYDYYVDGIFGPRTEYAVRLAQSDLNRPVNGIADPDLQRIILNGGLSKYDPYRALTRGNRGLRVQLMQEQLRDLGYLADAADGIFGGNTQRAVQLFQSENGLGISDGATRETLQRLFSSSARRCSSFIDLYPGYTGYRVRELNSRLKDLYYLETSVGSTYTAETQSAVRAFQRQDGLRETGDATVPVLQALFAADAPEAPGYIVLRRGDENSRVEELQRRLRDLGYISGRITGYYGPVTQKAVELFQKNVGLKPTGVATVRTQQLLFQKDAPVYVKPTVIGTPVISVDAYHHRENGVFCIADDSSDTGYVTFSWSTEGEVKSFNVLIKDSKGAKLVDQDTLLTRTGVSISTLQYESPYTLTVTAYPEDGDKSHVTSASISFKRIETPEEPDPDEIGEVGDPVITIDTTLRTADGVSYVQPGAVTFHWYADGDVQSYYVDIQDASGVSRLNVNTTDEQASIRSDAMKPGEIYTLYVYVIPTNGTIDDATAGAERFALESIDLPTPTPEATEEPTPTPEPTEEPTQAPEVTEEPTQTPEPTEEPTQVPEVTEEPTQTPEPTQEPEKPAAAPASVSTPVIAFEPVAAEEGGVNYIDGDVVGMHWFAEGDVQSYYVEIVNSSDAVQASTTTDKESLAVKAQNLVAGEVYTLNVTAIPEGGSVEDGASASASFARYLAPEPEITPEPVYEEPEVEEPEYEEPVVEEPVYEEHEYEEPEYEEPEYEEPEYEEPEYEEPEYEEPEYEEPEYEEPVNEEPEYEEPEYEEPEYEEPEYEEPEAEAAAYGPVGSDSDPSLIGRIQKRLAAWGWLSDYTEGELDDATMEAVYDFESYYNANYGGSLSSGDSISGATVDLILNENGDVYSN